MMLGVLVLEMTLVTAIIVIRVMQSSTITMTNDIIDNNYKNVDDDNNGENYYSYIILPSAPHARVWYGGFLRMSCVILVHEWGLQR